MTTPAPLHVIIIGAGLAGLATALSTKLANPSHRVTVLESVKELQEVGVNHPPPPSPSLRPPANPPPSRPASK